MCIRILLSARLLLILALMEVGKLINGLDILYETRHRIHMLPYRMASSLMLQVICLPILM